MWNEPTKKQLDKIPKLYETENIPLKDKIIHMHFFLGNADWYITEYDGDDLFFGYVDLGNPAFAEWGYISFKELRTCEGFRFMGTFEVDRNLGWEPIKASLVPKIKV